MSAPQRGNGHGNGSGQAPPPAPMAFPCRIDIKAMGRQSIRFEALVQSIVSRHVQPQDLHAVRARPSRKNRYVALTLTITAHSRAQLDAIYQDLSACDDVLVAL